MEIENTNVSGNEIFEEGAVENGQTEEIQEEVFEEPVEENAPDSPQDILDDSESTENVMENIQDLSGVEDSADASAVVEDSETVSGSDVGEDVSAFGDSDTESVSGGDVYYITEVPEEPSIWEKPMKNYTVVDGILITFLVVCIFVYLWFAIKEKG